MNFEKIIEKESFAKKDIIELLSINDKENLDKLINKAYQVKSDYVGRKVFFRGLIELSNYCEKNCLYCGIRSGNKNVERYFISDEEVLGAAGYAYKNNFASIVLQSGEQTGEEFIARIAKLVKEIKLLSNGELGITLSLGEQTEETYKYWFSCGAHRYLIRIETSDKIIYNKIHPKNKKHSFEDRLDCLIMLKKIGYQVGTGVMIGLPFQTIDNLADDLLFMRNMDIDMVGMGPYIEHTDTPLYQYRELLMPRKERLLLAFKMIATLRIMMKDINIAATTALQAIDPVGREKALKAGANIIMPNITPTRFREEYQLYQDKPCLYEGADDCKTCLETRISLAGDEIGYGDWGDSKHFSNRIKD